MSRDDFKASVKAALAKRAGYRCSFPECPAVTIGPSDESDVATSSTGEAAHISAASGGPGARRYVASLTPEERSSIENGIWCCNVHAKLIDTDESTYSIPMLKQWRLLAERRAQLRQAYGANIDACQAELIGLGLAPDELKIENDAELNQEIGLSVQLSCIADICGDDVAHVLRDFLIEHVKNAFGHGGASSIHIEYQQNAIHVIDDGAAFAISSLSAEDGTRGGGLAFRALLETKQLGYASSRRSDDGKNHVFIPLIVNPWHLSDLNPCAVTLDRQSVRSGQFGTANFVGCDRAFVIAPDYMSYSDGPMLEAALAAVVNDNPNVVVVVPNVSKRVLRHFQESFPEVRVEGW